MGYTCTALQCRINLPEVCSNESELTHTHIGAQVVQKDSQLLGGITGSVNLEEDRFDNPMKASRIIDLVVAKCPSNSVSLFLRQFATFFLRLALSQDYVLIDQLSAIYSNVSQLCDSDSRYGFSLINTGGVHKFSMRYRSVSRSLYLVGAVQNFLHEDSIGYYCELQRMCYVVHVFAQCARDSASQNA